MNYGKVHIIRDDKSIPVRNIWDFLEFKNRKDLFDKVGNGAKRKNKIIVPPLKSQGIKTKLVPWIKSILPNFTGQWIEPFFGTGVVGFNIKSQRAILADTNPHIIEFYSDLKMEQLHRN